MSTARQSVDQKTVMRLRSRRVLVVAADAVRAEALARVLREGGAAAVAITPETSNHAPAHALDADVMLVNEDEPEPCRPLVIALRRHPRTRWTTVMPISFASLWVPGSDQPVISGLADEVSRLATGLMELTVRARGKLPHHTTLEPLGPSRLLRALDGGGRKLRITVSDGRLRGELDLVDGRVAAVRVVMVDSGRRLVNVEALAAILAMSSGDLRIDDWQDSGKPRWNSPLTVALESASALAMMANGEPATPPAASGVRPAISEQLAASGALLEPPSAAANLKPTVPQIAISDVLVEAAMMAFEADPNDAEPASSVADVGEGADVAPLADDEVTAHAIDVEEVLAPTPSFAPSLPSDAPLRKTRSRAPHVLAAAALALAAASAVAWSARSPSRPAPNASAKPIPPPAELPPPAPAAPSALLPSAVAAQPAQPIAEGAPIPLPAPRQPSRSELKHARRIVKRGDHYLQDDRPQTAAEAYLKALAIAPDYAPAIRPLVQIYLRRGSAADAREWAQHLAAVEPDNPNSQLLLGDAYALGNEDALAVQAWQRASALGSDAARKRLKAKR